MNAPLTPEEFAQLDRIADEFADCGETEVPYETLMDFAQRGYLECRQFALTPKANQALAAGVKVDVDAAAKALYETWRQQPGWVPWVDGGNSFMQDKARRDAAGVPGTSKGQG